MSVPAAATPVAVSARPSGAHRAIPSPDRADPCTVVIFGAAGDLTRRKLLPALYQLAREDLLANDFRVLGVSRETIGDDGFRSLMRTAVGQSDEIDRVLRSYPELSDDEFVREHRDRWLAP